MDPPPIIQVKIKHECRDPYEYLYHGYTANGDHSNYLQSPHFLVCADPNLCTTTEPPTQTPVNNALAGSTVSSLHKLKDIDNSGTFPWSTSRGWADWIALDRGFFVFGDLYEGEYRLKFHVFEVVKYVYHIGPAQTVGYAVIPTYFPNKAAFSRDLRHLKVLCLWVEYQVLDQCATGLLFGRDALKAYAMDIEESTSTILVRMPNRSPPFRIPIAESDRFSKRKHDARVFLAEDVNVRPHSEIWLPIHFQHTGDDVNLLFSPRRFTDLVEPAQHATPF